MVTGSCEIECGTGRSALSGVAFTNVVRITVIDDIMLIIKYIIFMIIIVIIAITITISINIAVRIVSMEAMRPPYAQAHRPTGGDIELPRNGIVPVSYTVRKSSRLGPRVLGSCLHLGVSMASSERSGHASSNRTGSR